MRVRKYQVQDKCVEIIQQTLGCFTKVFYTSANFQMLYFVSFCIESVEHLYIRRNMEFNKSLKRISFIN